MLKNQILSMICIFLFLFHLILGGDELIRELSFRSAKYFRPIRIYPYFALLTQNFTGAEFSFQELIQDSAVPASLHYLRKTVSTSPRVGNILLERECITYSQLDNTKCLEYVTSGQKCGEVLIPTSHFEQTYSCVENEIGVSCPNEVPGGLGVPNSDVIIYMSIDESTYCKSTTTSDTVKAHSGVCLRDKVTDRPIAGYINFCRPLVSFTLISIEEYVTDILREMFRVLAFNYDSFAHFRNSYNSNFKTEYPLYYYPNFVLNSKVIEDPPWTPRDPRTNLPYLISVPASVLRVRASRNFLISSSTIKTLDASNYLATPQLIAAANDQYDCYGSSYLVNVPGVPLFVPLSSVEYLVGWKTDWDPRFIRNEIMSGETYRGSPAVVSNMTLAVLDDSGWYRTNRDNAQLLRWGYKEGCHFVRHHICPVDVKFRHTCTFSRLFNLETHAQDAYCTIDFASRAHCVVDGVNSNDFCSVWRPLPDDIGSCRVTADTKTQDPDNYYGEDSTCAIKNSVGYCFKYLCHNTTHYDILADGFWWSCFEGEVKKAYRFELECPTPIFVCSGGVHCLNYGQLVDGVCKCLPGFIGWDCSVRDISIERTKSPYGFVYPISDINNVDIIYGIPVELHSFPVWPFIPEIMIHKNSGFLNLNYSIKTSETTSVHHEFFNGLSGLHLRDSDGGIYGCVKLNELNSIFWKSTKYNASLTINDLYNGVLEVLNLMTSFEEIQDMFTLSFTSDFYAINVTRFREYQESRNSLNFVFNFTKLDEAIRLNEGRSEFSILASTVDTGLSLTTPRVEQVIGFNLRLPLFYIKTVLNTNVVFGVSNITTINNVHVGIVDLCSIASSNMTTSLEATSYPYMRESRESRTYRFGRILPSLESSNGINIPNGVVDENVEEMTIIFASSLFELIHSKIQLDIYNIYTMLTNDVIDLCSACNSFIIPTEIRRETPSMWSFSFISETDDLYLTITSGLSYIFQQNGNPIDLRYQGNVIAPNAINGDKLLNLIQKYSTATTNSTDTTFILEGSKSGLLFCVSNGEIVANSLFNRVPIVPIFPPADDPVVFPLLVAILVGIFICLFGLCFFAYLLRRRKPIPIIEKKISDYKLNITDQDIDDFLNAMKRSEIEEEPEKLPVRFPKEMELNQVPFCAYDHLRMAPESSNPFLKRTGSIIPPDPNKGYDDSIQNTIDHFDDVIITWPMTRDNDYRDEMQRQMEDDLQSIPSSDNDDEYVNTQNDDLVDEILDTHGHTYDERNRNMLLDSEDQLLTPLEPFAIDEERNDFDINEKLEQADQINESKEFAVSGSSYLELSKRFDKSKRSQYFGIGWDRYMNGVENVDRFHLRKK